MLPGQDEIRIRRTAIIGTHLLILSAWRRISNPYSNPETDFHTITFDGDVCYGELGTEIGQTPKSNPLPLIFQVFPEAEHRGRPRGYEIDVESKTFHYRLVASGYKYRRFFNLDERPPLEDLCIDKLEDALYFTPQI